MEARSRVEIPNMTLIYTPIKIRPIALCQYSVVTQVKHLKTDEKEGYLPVYIGRKG